MRIILDLDTETAERLVRSAVRNRRPAAMHAGWLLRKALAAEERRAAQQALREEAPDRSAAAAP